MAVGEDRLFVPDDPWYQPIARSEAMSEERWNELRQLRSSWRLGDTGKPVPRQVVDRYVEGLEDALDEIHRLRRANGG